MGMTGERRRRVWRWAVAVWAVAVIVGGGFTLWLQDSVKPPGPYRWEQAEATSTPSLPEGWETQCPTPSAGADEDGPVAIACLIVTTR
ncbi:hypothetical protein [Streptomyces sp. S.PNR 29]|uniref:hypothetical protein n=1 Tax=Streptomyces sp. S.PNR 29 TaxID=2973805 RepID=UPI0025B13D9D|nr:hypothetical protein [Streptomyces sp. S.PNR 29]MDN0195688.1 hypothetical protein [Streptomyces sp. S.PNR 29]